jgi:hypothetical protein
VLAEIDRDYKAYEDLPAFPGVAYYYPFERDGSTEYGIRPLGDLALGVAVMLKTSSYAPETAKVDDAEALRRVELAIRGIAFTHRANRAQGRTWGGRCNNSTCWQAAYWASLAGQSAWMLWDELSDDTHEAVAKMIEYEADSFKNYDVPYRWAPDGTDLYPGDTKSEENAWNARLLVIAQGMMPEHPNVGRWRRKASELLISAYSRPGDKKNDTIVDGKPVREWVHGANMAEDGVLVNHRMVQPDYIACDAELRGTAAIVASLANQQIPESAFFNAKIVYSALTEIDFKPGPSPYGNGTILAPGGAIYIRTGRGRETVYSAQVYYPQGADWVRADIPIVMSPHLNMDLYAEIFRFDAGKDFDAMGWAHARVDRLLEMQARSGEAGNVYQPGDWVADYYSNEQVIFETNAEALLLWWLHERRMISPIGSGWGSAAARDDGRKGVIGRQLEGRGNRTSTFGDSETRGHGVFSEG